MSELRTRISQATTDAMKAREKTRVAALRLINAELKSVEVDERKSLSDDDVVTVLTRMLKQRRDSEQQFKDAGRQDLVDQEAFEIALIGEFMPEPLGAAELQGLIEKAIAQAGAESMRDMGKVMALLKTQVQGRADMSVVSGLVKSALG